MSSHPRRRSSKTVLVFGTFDALHDGHRDFFRQARSRGGELGTDEVRLLVVVARDSFIRNEKGREPRSNEQARLAAVEGVTEVAEAILAQEWPAEDPYALLTELDFDVLALGYDQRPDDDVVRAELDRRGKEHVVVVRLRPHEPERFKSSRAPRGE